MIIPKVDNPTVSIIIPVFNSEIFLEQAIQSILGQIFDDWEMIIVDDCSIDGSYELVCEFARGDPRIKPIRLQRNRGASFARNTAIESSSGRYLAFCDCDDIWLPSKLDRQLKMMQNNDLGFTWHSYQLINSEGNKIRDQFCASAISYKDLLKKRSVIGCLSAIYDVYAFGKQLMPDIRMRQDYGLWLRLLRIAETQGIKCGGIEEILACYRVHAGAMTKNKAKAAYYQWRLYRDIENLPFVTALSCFKDYTLNAFRDRY